MKKSRMSFVAIFLVILMFVTGCKGKSADAENETVSVSEEYFESETEVETVTEIIAVSEETSTEIVEEKVEKKDLVCGDKFENDNLIFTYLDCGEYTPVNEYMCPSDGCRYIYFTVCIESKNDTICTAYNDFTYNDKEGINLEYDSLNATLYPHKKAVGNIYFEVGETETVDKVTYTYDYYSNETLTLEFSPDTEREILPVEKDSTLYDGAFHIDETVEKDGISVTMTACGDYVLDDIYESEYMVPKDGYKIIYAEFEIDNTTTEIFFPECICYADGIFCQPFYSVTADYIGYSYVAENGTLKGYYTFYAPADAENAEYYLNLDSTNIEQCVFNTVGSAEIMALKATTETETTIEDIIIETEETTE